MDGALVEEGYGLHDRREGVEECNEGESEGRPRDGIGTTRGARWAHDQCHVVSGVQLGGKERVMMEADVKEGILEGREKAHGR